MKYGSDWSRICAAAPWHSRALKNSNCERVLWPTFYHFHVDAAIFFLVGIILFSRPLRSRELCAFHVKSMKIDDASAHDQNAKSSQDFTISHTTERIVNLLWVKSIFN